MTIPRIIDAARQRVGRILGQRTSRSRHFPMVQAPGWPERIRDAIACPDNAAIPRHPDAGLLQDRLVVMHNGLKVSRDGYYGPGITEMLVRNRGCHEPQEELVFQAALQLVPDNASMLELGAYWGFYSMWFLQGRPQRRAWLVEPDPNNLLVGLHNLELNRMFAWAALAATGDKPDFARTPPVVSVDYLLGRICPNHVDILHADIQGHEAAMLAGAAVALRERRIDYLFISTHSSELHVQCEALLSRYDYTVHASVPPAASYSVDGVLVAARPELRVSLPRPSLRSTEMRDPEQKTHLCRSESRHR